MVTKKTIAQLVLYGALLFLPIFSYSYTVQFTFQNNTQYTVYVGIFDPTHCYHGANPEWWQKSMPIAPQQSQTTTLDYDGSGTICGSPINDHTARLWFSVRNDSGQNIYWNWFDITSDPRGTSYGYEIWCSDLQDNGHSIPNLSLSCKMGFGSTTATIQTD